MADGEKESFGNREQAKKQKQKKWERKREWRDGAMPGLKEKNRENAGEREEQE